MVLELISYGIVGACLAQISVQSRLYCRYKPLVVALQGACTQTTRCLYGDYKVLVLALQGAVY